MAFLPFYMFKYTILVSLSHIRRVKVEFPAPRT